MQRRFLLGIIALLLLIFLLTLVLMIPHSTVLAHTITILDTPTPTPDANTILNQANQALSRSQDTLNFMNVLLTFMGLLLAVAGAAVGVFAYFGIADRRATEKVLRENLKAIEEIKENAASSRTALVYLSLGDRLLSQRNIDAAITTYKKVGRLLPKDAEVNSMLGRIYNGIGYFDDAIASFEKSLENHPDNSAEVYKELGVAYRRRGDLTKSRTDYDNAIDCLKVSTTLHDDSDAFAILGGIYRRLKEYEQALKYYHSALRINPASSYALGNVASLSWYLGKPNEARKYFRITEAVASVRVMDGGHPDGYWDYYDQALAQLVLGNLVEAKKSWQEAIKLTPSKVQLESVLDNLYLLQRANDKIAGLDDVITMLEQREKSLP